ncbi:G patch domain-containing protein 3 [Fukomys damarensis]|uniref:G patch domain-containing protein 3 n=1 Tax=Fukomys damarensis TaxID=885580 RepID=A0A091E045_FUKDA|nr:G patch domain-containing protein 3 [Fukomys damarensis]KFO37694.1 G patch domain-containing protein 3 [Fukomys damarensis]
MAVPSDAEVEAAVYLVVSGIPSGLRSAQLRSYFSQFREQRGGGFLCFHYRHRPELVPPHPGTDSALTSADSGAESQIFAQTAATDARSVSTREFAQVQSHTCCCVISVRGLAQAQKLLRMYSGRRWLDSQGSWLPGRCLIRRLRLPTESSGLGSFPFKTRKELQSRKSENEAFTLADLRQLPELNPPVLMPNGNVGTPLQIFLDLIRACRLPPRIITQLQLQFPKTGSSRRYGNVPFQYEDSETVEQEEPVYTAEGEEIPQGTCLVDPPEDEEAEDEGEKEVEETHSDDDDDCGEEWERHEALHEDVTGQERTSERLFEEEIELKWEKGGSGLVFYTDAQFWQEEEGDFDEQTADDWDVDMSVYYDRDGGDKDARDSVQMRLEQRLRDGQEEVSVIERQVGTFERYTKGIGRKVMERQGWAEGQGLGSSCSGVPEALDGDGQHPRCKRGLGYHGEKLQPFGLLKRPRGTGLGLISTIYDEPLPQDQGESLLRRQLPTSMKFRTDIAFVRGSSWFSDRPSEPD